MSRKPNTLETVNLAIELLRRIPRNRKITAKELHQQLRDAGYSRDLRTIQRQLDTLSEHFDIDRDTRDKPYGYRWKEQSRGLSLPVLSRQESLLLILAEQHLRNLLPVSLTQSLESFFIQARSNLDHSGNARREREWLDKVRVISTSQPLLPPQLQEGVFEAVSEALYENLWLAIEYRNAAGIVSDAEIMPLGLAQQGPRLYLVCRYKGYDNERTLAMNRIQSARVSTLHFSRPREFDLQKYEADGRFGFGHGERIWLRFCITRDAGLHILESPLSLDQVVEEHPEYYVIAATVVDSAQLEWWLRGFGDEVWGVERRPLSTGKCIE